VLAGENRIASQWISWFGGDMTNLLLWLMVFIFCWPLALVALVLYPLVWLAVLPFRVVGIAADGILELLRALVALPARLLGGAQA
jgi:hypothetical protein